MTHLAYLSDTYLFKTSWIIEEIWENEYGQYIILTETIFYPQWGGQPSDTGTISGAKGIFSVKNVRINEEWTVYHYGEYAEGVLEIWEVVMLTLDEERRRINARNHSAGHLIDIAIKNIWLVNIFPTKWYHFSDGPYVEYSGNLDRSIDEILPILQNEVDSLIAENISVTISYDTNAKSPTGKTPRYVQFEGFEWCGCGGTHVKNTGEILAILIRKMKMKDGFIRVSYSIK